MEPDSDELGRLISWFLNTSDPGTAADYLDELVALTDETNYLSIIERMKSTEGFSTVALLMYLDEISTPQRRAILPHLKDIEARVGNSPYRTLIADLIKRIGPDVPAEARRSDRPANLVQRLEALEDDMATRTPALRLTLCVLMTFTLLTEFGQARYGSSLICATGAVLVLFFTDQRAYEPLMERLKIPIPNLVAFAGAVVTALIVWLVLWLW